MQTSILVYLWKFATKTQFTTVKSAEEAANAKRKLIVFISWLEIEWVTWKCTCLSVPKINNFWYAHWTPKFWSWVFLFLFVCVLVIFMKKWRKVIHVSPFDLSVIYIICRSAVFAKWWSHLVTLDYVKKITAMCSLKWPWAQFSEVRSFRFIFLYYNIASMTIFLLFIFLWCQKVLYNRLANLSVLEVSSYLFAGIFRILVFTLKSSNMFIFRA